jgi:hypothetical protein
MSQGDASGGVARPGSRTPLLGRVTLKTTRANTLEHAADPHDYWGSRGSWVQIPPSRQGNRVVDRGVCLGQRPCCLSIVVGPNDLGGDRLGPLGDRPAFRWALSALPAASNDRRSWCRYRCVVVICPCPAIFWSTCTGTPASASHLRPVCRRSCRRRCSYPSACTVPILVYAT